MFEEDGTVLIFVYGTLRRGASEGARMVEAEYLGRRGIAGGLCEIDSMPALVQGHAERSKVWGDLYRVRTDQLQEIDRWHGGDGSYSRAWEDVFWPRDERARKSAWVWRWSGATDHAVVVPSGDWLDVEHPRTWPLFTCVAAAALASPPTLMAVVQDQYAKAGHPDFIPSPLGYIIVLGALSPFVGCAASYLARRRREKWPQVQEVILSFLFLECIPGAFILVAALGEVTNWF